MQDIAIIGLDLAKSVFQVHGVKRTGDVVARKMLRRAQVLDFFRKLPSCLVGLEACGSAHHWAREIAACGHNVRMIPPIYVKAYVKRGKTDAADAAAICEAVGRPTMRFVPIKTVEQQAAGMVLKVRDLLVRQRTQIANAFRSHLSELGIVTSAGLSSLDKLAAIVRDPDTPMPDLARRALLELAEQIDVLSARVEDLDADIRAGVKEDETARRLTSIPGVGPLIAATVCATVHDPNGFRRGRDFAAWLGLTPRLLSTGGKEKLGSISKQGNRRLRTLLIIGVAWPAAHDRLGQRHGVHLERRPCLVRGRGCRLVLYRPGQADAERLLRELQRPYARRTPERDAVPRPAPCPREARELGHRLQHRPTSLGARLPHTGSASRPPHRNGRSAAQPRPAPPIARCSILARRRINRKALIAAG